MTGTHVAHNRCFRMPMLKATRTATWLTTKRMEPVMNKVCKCIFITIGLFPPTGSPTQKFKKISRKIPVFADDIGIIFNARADFTGLFSSAG